VQKDNFNMFGASRRWRHLYL